MHQNLSRALLGLSLIAVAWNFRTLAADQPQWGHSWSRNMVS